MRRYLVVANQTLGGAALAHVIRERIEQGPCTVHVVVPATPPREHFVWTEGMAHDIAQHRLDVMLTWLRAQGIEATGDVGDQQPMLAVGDALIKASFDEVILSTLPAGASKWLGQDLPNRLRRHYGIHVTHVVGDSLPTRATA